MSFLGHSEYFAHLTWCWSCTADTWCQTTSFIDSICLSKFFKIWMFKCLRCRQSVIMIIDEKLRDNVTSFWILRHNFMETSSFLFWEIKLHMTCNFLKLVEQFFLRSSDNIMNFIYLIQFILTGK